MTSRSPTALTSETRPAAFSGRRHGLRNDEVDRDDEVAGSSSHLYVGFPDPRLRVAGVFILEAESCATHGLFETGPFRDKVRVECEVAVVGES